MKRVAFQVLGWVLLGLGLVGLFLPLLPGILLLMTGLFVLSREYAWAGRLMKGLRSKFPELSRKAEAWWQHQRFRWGRGTT
jgi:uncharacterized membrane protein YbaN (DUF454 family)